MTGIFDRLAHIAKTNNKYYREICISILDYMLTQPYWLKYIDIYEITDFDCRTIDELLAYMEKLRSYLKGEINVTEYSFLDFILNDDYYNSEQIPFFDLLHDVAHSLARRRIIPTDSSLLTKDIIKLIDGRKNGY